MVCSSIVELVCYLSRCEKSHIELILAGRNKQRISDRFHDILSSDEYEFIEYDATRSLVLDINADYIIHGASNANPTVYAKEPMETLLGNIIGLNNILNVARDNIGSRILYIYRRVRFMAIEAINVMGHSKRKITGM